MAADIFFCAPASLSPNCSHRRFCRERRKRGSDTPQPQPSSKKRKEVDYSPLLIPENSFIISHKNHCQCYYPRYSSGKMKIVAHLVKGEMKTIEKGTSCLSRVLRLLSGHINQGSSTSPPENRPSWPSRPIPLINRRNQSNLAAREVLKTDIKTRLLWLSLREDGGVPSLT